MKNKTKDNIIRFLAEAIQTLGEEELGFTSKDICDLLDISKYKFGAHKAHFTMKSKDGDSF